MTELVPLRRNRDFVLYQSGQMLSLFGSGTSSVTHPWWQALPSAPA